MKGRGRGMGYVFVSTNSNSFSLKTLLSNFSACFLIFFALNDDCSNILID
jgi:hypothetical protein